MVVFPAICIRIVACFSLYPHIKKKKLHVHCSTAYTTRTLSPYTELGLTSIASFLQNQ